MSRRLQEEDYFETDSMNRGKTRKIVRLANTRNLNKGASFTIQGISSKVTMSLRVFLLHYFNKNILIVCMTARNNELNTVNRELEPPFSMDAL